MSRKNVEEECRSFCDQVCLNELISDTERLRFSMSDKDFLPLIEKFAVNIIRLNDILSSFQQENSPYSPMIRFRYGRELRSFLAGTADLFFRQDIRKRLIKLQRLDLVDEFAKIGVL